MSRWIELVLLCVDAVLLAVLEAMYLPLRLDGTVLPDWGSVPFPVVVVLALLTTPALVRRAGQLTDRIALGALPALVWFAALLVFGFLGPGGDRALLPDWRGLLLLAAGLLPSAVVLGLTTVAVDRAGSRRTRSTES